jgi:hypothetical protein
MPVNIKKIQRGSVPFSRFGFKKLKDTIEKVSLDIVLEAKAQHRFTARTGNLERSIKNRVTAEANKILSIFELDNKIANYGKFIHNGFRSWKPDPFLEDSFNKHIKRLKKLLKDKMKAMI